MKKLMIALSAAAMAFGLHAADAGFISGDNIESYNAGEFTPSGLWSHTGAGDKTLTVATDGVSTKVENERPLYFGHNENTKYLNVKTTFGQPLSLKIGESARTIGDGLYFDSLVKFTACDADPEGYSDAKLLVYIKTTDENETATNLFVRAGYIKSDKSVITKTYDCGPWTKGDAWVRLTIKAIDNITKKDFCPGFVVFVDGLNNAQDPVVPCACTDDKMDEGATTLTDSAAAIGDGLFPGSVGTILSQNNTITSVGFDGQGAIDDLAFTTTPPFKGTEDALFFTLNWTSDVTGFTWNNGTESGSKPATGTSTLIPYTAGATMSVTISGDTYADGKMAGAFTADGATVAGKVFTVTADGQSGWINAQNVGVTIGDQKFATLDEAFAYINSTATGNVVMELKSGLASGVLTSPISIAAKDGLTSVKIDLAGKTISCATDGFVITSAVPLWITDSATGGKIENTITGDEVMVGAVMVAAEEGSPTLTIDAGTFDGMVVADAGEISGGSFKDVSGEASEEFYLAGLLKSGYVATLDNGYYVVSEAPYTGPEQDAQGNFLIKTEQDLRWVSDHFADYQNATLIQQNDIALTKVWNGIGRYGKDHVGAEDTFKGDAFQGVYDGQNYAITGLKLKSDYATGAATNKYIGFFFSTYKAEIKNVKFGIANYGWDNGKSIGQDVGCGLVIGTAWGTTVSNVVTIVGEADGEKELYGTHALSGFAGFTAHDNTFVDCVNNLYIHEARASGGKVGGYSACSQQSPALKFIRCVNNGKVYSENPAATGVGGFVGYCQGAAEFADCTNNGEVTQGAEFAAGGEYVYTNLGGNTGKGNIVVVQGAKSVDFNFAIVAGEPAVATFVKDADVALNGSYKVVNAAATYAFAGPGSITFDKTLAPSFAPTPPAGYQVTNVGDVYTCSLIPVTGVTLDKETLTMNVGDVSNLVATVAPDTVLDNKVVWSVVEGDAVTVEAGAVTAVKAGTATVKAAANADSTKFATCVVTVTAPAPADWPDPTTIAEGTKASDIAGASIPASLANVSAKALVVWAKKFDIKFPGDSIKEKAFLLNCENTDAAIETAEANFKFTEIVPGTKPTIEGDYNGEVVVESFSDAACTTSAESGDQLFYKAKLVPANVPEVK